MEELRKLAKTPAFRAEAEAMFFEAMLQGYVNGAEMVPVAGFPGFKMAPPYVRGPWTVSDPYVNSALRLGSSGTTTIWFRDFPVWTMQYLGWYHKDAIPCLKAALRAAYEKKQFFAGRGPKHFEHEGYLYENTIDPGASFNGQFGCEEIIYSPKNEVMGGHVIRGMAQY